MNFLKLSVQCSAWQKKAKIRRTNSRTNCQQNSKTVCHWCVFRIGRIRSIIFSLSNRSATVDCWVGTCRHRCWSVNDVLTPCPSKGRAHERDIPYLRLPEGAFEYWDGVQSNTCCFRYELVRATGLVVLALWMWGPLQGITKQHAETMWSLDDNASVCWRWPCWWFTHQTL